MANLVENLQSIYSTKQQIKDVLNTQSDVFADYPDLIRQRIEESAGSGESGGAVLSTQYIDRNGDYYAPDFGSDGFERVIVAVPQEGGGEVIDTGFKFPDNNNSEQPWTCNYAKKISDEELTDGMYWEDKGHFGFVSVAGIVTEVQYTYSEQFNTARFTIADGNGYDLSNGAVKCFAVNFSEGGLTNGEQWDPERYEQIEVGDYVIVSTRFTRYYDAGLGYSYPECYGGHIYKQWKVGKRPA